MKRVWICLLAAAATLAAQPFTSPAATASVTIDGKAIKVDYHAPSMHGRKIFGGLVPYSKVWRAGANQATLLHTEADLDIGGVAVPKGDYSLYILPEQNEWKLIVNKKTGQWGIVRDGGTSEDPAEDVGRATMQLGKTGPVETFKISLIETGPKAGKLQMEWENTVASVPIAVK
jgi:Protein of unknown function (DUF2911)